MVINRKKIVAYLLECQKIYSSFILDKMHDGIAFKE